MQSAYGSDPSGSSIPVSTEKSHQSSPSKSVMSTSKPRAMPGSDSTDSRRRGKRISSSSSEPRFYPLPNKPEKSGSSKSPKVGSSCPFVMLFTVLVYCAGCVVEDYRKGYTLPGRRSVYWRVQAFFQNFPACTTSSAFPFNAVLICPRVTVSVVFDRAGCLLKTSLGMPSMYWFCTVWTG